MKLETNRITVPRDARVPEVASFVAQLDALSTYMIRDLNGITRAELAWQPKRGQNTIGMLLLHIAIVEVYWILTAEERYSDAALQNALGVDINDDGMPLGTRGVAPAALRAKSFAFYRRALGRARAFLRRRTARLGRRDLDHEFIRTRRSGQKTLQNIRWILFHILEHQAGHYGQVLLLRHQYRDRRVR